MYGDVMTLFVSVSLPASVASVPVSQGSVMTAVPATAGASIIALPDVVPAIFSLPTLPAVPNVLTPVIVSFVSRKSISPSVTAVLSCAFVVVTVFVPSDIDLFVSASELVRVGTTTLPDFILPVPFGFMFMSIFVSQPVAASIGQVVVAALEIVNSFTADATSVSGNLISSFVQLSYIPLTVEPNILNHPFVCMDCAVELFQVIIPQAVILLEGFTFVAVSTNTQPILQLSSIVTALFWISFQVVALNLATALSVALAGHTTSPLPLGVEAIVIIPSAPVPVVVRVIFVPSTNLILPPVAESVAVCEVASLVFVIV